LLVSVNLWTTAKQKLGRQQAVHLDVDVKKPAVLFYESQGYEPVVETRVPAMSGVNAHFRMIKRLP
jgi:hypothetical protein